MLRAPCIDTDNRSMADGGRREWLVRWTTWPAEEDSWESEHDLVRECPELLVDLLSKALDAQTRHSQAMEERLQCHALKQAARVDQMQVDSQAGSGKIRWMQSKILRASRKHLSMQRLMRSSSFQAEL